MKNINYSLLVSIILVSGCFLVTGCQKEPSFGLIYFAYDSQTKTNLVGRLNGRDNSEQIITTVKETPLEFEIADVSDDGKRIVVIKPAEEIVNQSRAIQEPALFFLDEGKLIQEKVLGVTSAILSPDGNQIALIYEGSLWIGNVNEINNTNIKLIVSSQHVVPNSITWSPDGRYIAYTKSVDWSSVSQTYNKYALYTKIEIINLSTLKSYELTNGSMGCYGPKWAPSGKWIAMTCRGVNDSLYRIKLVNPDGKELRTINEKDESCFFPAWSPTENLIIYTCLKDTSDSVYYFQVDENREEIVPIKIIKSVREIGDIVWTPDGKFIILVVRSSENSLVNSKDYTEQIIITDLDGSDQRIVDSEFSNYQYLYVYKLAK